MNFELSEDQQLMRETFLRFLNEESTLERVRAALPSGFDQVLWAGLAELGAFSLRVPTNAIAPPRERRSTVEPVRSIGA